MAKISIVLTMVMLTLLAQADTGILDSCYIPMVCDSGQASWMSYKSYKEMQVKASCEKKIKKIHDEFLTNMKDLKNQYNQLQEIVNEKTKESTTPLTSSQGTTKATTAITTTRNTLAIATTGTTADIFTTETTAAIATMGMEVTSTTPCHSGNGLISGSNCFWIGKLVSTVTYSQAKSLCEKDGGQPANIHDESQYNAVMNYIRINIPASHAGQYALWTGMKYDITNKIALLRNGAKAPFVKWYGDNRAPYKVAGWSQIGINVDIVATEPKQGMLNGEPSWGKHAVLCSQNIVSG